MEHPPNSIKNRWCTCAARCKGGAYLHPRTYARHRVHREADDAQERDQFYEEFGRPTEIVAVPVRKTYKVSNFYIMHELKVNLKLFAEEKVRMDGV
jgi:hypothetical protein